MLRLSGNLAANRHYGERSDRTNSTCPESSHGPGIWGAALFLVRLLTTLNPFGVRAGVRLLVAGLVIVAVITAAGGPAAQR